jgi:hypothetical protein
LILSIGEVWPTSASVHRPLIEPRLRAGVVVMLVAFATKNKSPESIATCHENASKAKIPLA